MEERELVRLKKMISITVLGIVALALILWVLARLAFEGAFDKKFTRSELTQNFIEHETSFKDLVTLFQTATRDEKDYDVSFGLGRAGSVNIYLRPVVTDPANKTIGGDNLRWKSDELDSVLVRLKWTKETAKKMRTKLSETGCDWIRTVEGDSACVWLYPNQTGWGSFTYVVYGLPLSGKIRTSLGTPISQSPFGKNVFLAYSSAL